MVAQHPDLHLTNCADTKTTTTTLGPNYCADWKSEVRKPQHTRGEEETQQDHDKIHNSINWILATLLVFSS